MTDEVRVALVDDHEMVRESLAEVLGSQPGLTIVGAVGDTAAAAQLAVDNQPDVMIFDVDMPGTSVFDVAERVRSLVPTVRLLFLSGFCNDRYIASAIEIEAHGYLTKSQPIPTIVEAVRAVAEGKTYFSDDVTARLVIGPDGPRLRSGRSTRLDSLSPRETEVLCYIAKGLSKKEAAAAMGIAVKTVDGHVERLMSKLEIHDRVELARFAIREGLVSP